MSVQMFCQVMAVCIPKGRIFLVNFRGMKRIAKMNPTKYAKFCVVSRRIPPPSRLLTQKMCSLKVLQKNILIDFECLSMKLFNKS